jgi:hypothetical protein
MLDYKCAIKDGKNNNYLKRISKIFIPYRKYITILN